MQTYKQLFKGGQATTIPVRGSTFIIQSSDQGNSVKVQFTQLGAIAYTVQDVGAGFKARPVLGFDGIVITATVDTNVEFIVTDGDIDLQITQQSVTITNPGVPVINGPAPMHVTVDGTVNVAGATLTATAVAVNNTTANPVPVSLVSEPGAPVPVSITGTPVAVTLSGSTDATAIPVQVQPPASAPTDVAPVTVGTAGGVLIAAGATRKGLRIRNAGTGNLAITAAAATTFANAAVVLRPGDVWLETDAPQAAWYAVSDTGTTANIQAVA